jgi:hypothetical protein
LSKQSPRDLIPSNGGFFQELALRVKLILKLMGDRRVNIFVKGLPLLTLAYIIWPLDALVGPIDDTILTFLGFYLFIELCPDDVVEEHMQSLRYGYTLNKQQPPADKPKEEPPTDVIEGEFHEVDEHDDVQPQPDPEPPAEG